MKEYRELFTGNQVNKFVTEVEKYLSRHKSSSIPLPSFEDFCLQYKYNIADVQRSGSIEVDDAVRKIYCCAKVILDKLILMDLSVPLKDSNGNTIRLDKKGIEFKLKEINKFLHS